MAFAIGLAAVGTAGAQGGVGGVAQPTRPGQRVPTPRERAAMDSVARMRARRDSAQRDSARKHLVDWVEPDSVMQALEAREGYTVTKYQGGSAVYRTEDHRLLLTGPRPGERAAVNRDQTIVVGDTIVYEDSLRMVTARGDTVTVRDPTRNEDDIVSIGQVFYNVRTHEAVAANVHTIFPSGGNRWYIAAGAGAYVGDTSHSANPANAFYGVDGAITTCDDSVPDYHFAVSELKFVTKHTLVGRPAVLYIADVPVMWLPFVLQDLRTGRRTGFLTPRFGVSELVRNSPSYRRHVENVGYYFALNDYTDLTTWLDWRSSARATLTDPGWTRYSGVFRYRWLDRFVNGSLGLSYQGLSNGQTNSAISWQHQQDFSMRSHLNMDINYETSTAIQQTTYFNPYAVLAVISSQLNFQDQLGPANVSLGGTQKQYPGRSEVDRVFPTLSVSTKPVAAGNWLTWTPSLAMSNSQSLNVDQFGNFAYRYGNTGGIIDSTRVRRNQRATTGSFDTPIKIFGFTWRNGVRLSDQANDFPEQDLIYTPAVVNGRDTTLPTQRIFSRTYNTSLDWETGIDLPSLAQGTWNIVPSVSVQNADPGAAFMIRTQFTGASFVTQPKRLVYGLSTSPTFFGLFPGFGGVARFRHSITPVISFSFAPRARISNAFYTAAGQNPVGSLAGLQQEAISLSLSQNIEAKLKGPPDQDPSQAKKVKVLSLNFDPVSYDFVRAHQTGRTLSGFTNGSWGYSLRSDLIPGFDFRQSYSLFQGDPLSDTARFKPYWQSISATLSLNRNSGLVAAVARLLGMSPPAKTANPDSALGARDPFLAQQLAAQSVVGGQVGVAPYAIATAGQGWQTSLTFQAYRQRPPVGNLANTIQFNPAVACLPYQNINPVYYQQCLLSKRTSTPDTNFNATTAAAPFVIVPPQTTLQASTSFNITPKWAAQWQTTYDFRAHQFASHIVTLQRDLHDWRAIFAFTQSPTGSFAFSFFVALKAEPALKFNYDKQTYRSPAGLATGQTY